MTNPPLPDLVQEFRRKYPAVWDAYSRLGEAVAQAGPLDARTERLVKLGIAVGAGLEGAFHSHLRRGLAEGLTREEVEHVVMLAITTAGWPRAFAAYSWLSDAAEKPA